MKKIILLVVVNITFLVVYAIGALRSDPAAAQERTSVANPEEAGASIIASSSQQPNAAALSVPQGVFAGAGGKEALPPVAEAGGDGKEALDPIGDKEVLEKEVLEPIGELTEAINPGSRPLIPNTEFFPERRGILTPPNPRNFEPPVVSPESR